MEVINVLEDVVLESCIPYHENISSQEIFISAFNQNR